MIRQTNVVHNLIAFHLTTLRCSFRITQLPAFADEWHMSITSSAQKSTGLYNLSSLLHHCSQNPTPLYFKPSFASPCIHSPLLSSVHHMPHMGRLQDLKQTCTSIHDPSIHPHASGVHKLPLTVGALYFESKLICP